jgi:putative NIF3 family GTP cyclohydrolase 1 type 2
MPTTTQIREYLLTNSPWVDRNKTVDTVKMGDPSRDVKKAGVCWYPSIDDINRAINEGCDLLVVHEPLFWDHLDRQDGPYRKIEPGLTRRKAIEDSGLVILRAHDTWDQWPVIGIRDSWAAGLGLDKPVYTSQGHNYHAIYEVTPQPLRVFAQYVADKIRPLGEDSVQVLGDPEREISRPALGVGCIGPDQDSIRAGADVIIVCYDGAPYWAVRERLVEAGAAVISVEHGSSEMWGLENLCKHLKEVFPDVTFEYYAEHPRTWTVRND